MTETVRAFARGLRVIRSFDAARQGMTLSEVARVSDLNRATARRLLLTLEQEGYVRRRDDRFELTARVLDLGYAFVSSFGVPEIAMPYLERLSEQVNEAASVGVLDDTDVVYVARVPAKRVMTVSIGLGSRFPAYRTSLGRAILSTLEDDKVAEIFASSVRSDPTPYTVSTLQELQAQVHLARSRGWAMVDQELELGVRSIAVPIRSGNGRALAAMNVSTHVSRTSVDELQERMVPLLLEAGAAVEADLRHRPE